MSQLMTFQGRLGGYMISIKGYVIKEKGFIEIVVYPIKMSE